MDEEVQFLHRCDHRLRRGLQFWRLQAVSRHFPGAPNNRTGRRIRVQVRREAGQPDRAPEADRQTDHRNTERDQPRFLAQLSSTEVPANELGSGDQAELHHRTARSVRASLRRRPAVHQAGRAAEGAVERVQEAGQQSLSRPIQGQSAAVQDRSAQQEERQVRPVRAGR